MRSLAIPALLASALAAAVAVNVPATRTAAQISMGDANAEPAPFNPQMAALMSMLIQPRLFNESYEKLTAGCNACHATTDHPFVVITAPTSPAAFPNQDFQPNR